MPEWHTFALQQQVPVNDTFCWHSQHCSPGVALFTHTLSCMEIFDFVTPVFFVQDTQNRVTYSTRYNMLCSTMHKHEN